MKRISRMMPLSFIGLGFIGFRDSERVGFRSVGLCSILNLTIEEYGG